MSIKQYRLRHMFQGTLEGTNTPIFFTRDEEHRLSELPEDQLKDAVAKGWIEEYDIPTMQDLKQRAKDAKAAEKSGSKKGGSR